MREVGQRAPPLAFLTARSEPHLFFPVALSPTRRLGWIPLQSETALEDLDQYPEEPEVHKYLHKRLMAFDLSTLYELHYLMITLGKVSPRGLRLDN